MEAIYLYVNFLFIKGTLFWLGIICYLLATQGQRLPGVGQGLNPRPSDSHPDTMPICHGDPAVSVFSWSSLLEPVNLTSPNFAFAFSTCSLRFSSLVLAPHSRRSQCYHGLANLITGKAKAHLTRISSQNKAHVVSLWNSIVSWLINYNVVVLISKSKHERRAYRHSFWAQKGVTEWSHIWKDPKRIHEPNRPIRRFTLKLIKYILYPKSFTK